MVRIPHLSAKVPSSIPDREHDSNCNFSLECNNLYISENHQQMDADIVSLCDSKVTLTLCDCTVILTQAQFVSINPRMLHVVEISYILSHMKCILLIMGFLGFLSIFLLTTIIILYTTIMLLL